MAIPKIILDTDMGCDCDDTAALALLHELANDGRCEILATTSCFRGREFASCLDAINRHYGRGDIPVGAFPDEECYPYPAGDNYARKTAEKFPNRYIDGKEDYPCTLSLLRKTLAEAEEGEVTLVAIGTLYSLRMLLESEGDDISPLSGRELIRRKTLRTVIMGGRFHSRWPEDIILENGYKVDAEFNIKADIPSAKAVCENWPGELVLCSYEMGIWLHTGAEFQLLGKDRNPAAYAYSLYDEKYHMGPGRESWDLSTVLYAACPEGFFEKSAPGKLFVDDIGVTTIEFSDDGKGYYLINSVNFDKLKAFMDSMLMRDFA